MLQTHIRRGKRVDGGVAFTWLTFSRLSQLFSNRPESPGWTIRFGKWTHILKLQQIETVIGKGARYLCPVLQLGSVARLRKIQGSLCAAKATRILLWVRRQQLQSKLQLDLSPLPSREQYRRDRVIEARRLLQSRHAGDFGKQRMQLWASWLVALCGMPLAHAQKRACARCAGCHLGSCRRRSDFIGARLGIGTR